MWIWKIIEQQSKLTFNGIPKSYENRNSFTFKQNEVVLDKAIYVGFAILEWSKLHMYETYYDKLQPPLDRKIYNYTILIPMICYWVWKQKKNYQRFEKIRRHFWFQ